MLSTSLWAQTQGQASQAPATSTGAPADSGKKHTEGKSGKHHHKKHHHKKS
jgi:hypothetical protein